MADTRERIELTQRSIDESRHAHEIADANAAIAKLQRTIERARKAADMGHLLTVQKILEGKE